MPSRPRRPSGSPGSGPLDSVPPHPGPSSLAGLIAALVAQIAAAGPRAAPLALSIGQKLETLLIARERLAAAGAGAAPPNAPALAGDVPAGDTAPVPADTRPWRARYDGLTPARRQLFLERLAATRSVRAAAAACGLAPQGLYRARAHPGLAAFREAWDAILAAPPAAPPHYSRHQEWPAEVDTAHGA